MEYDVIQVGGGVGGCVSAALLSKKGYRVLLIEKNDYLGGKAMSIEKNGHKIDMFAHLINSGGRINSLLEELGMGGELELVQEKPPILFKKENSSHDFSWDIAESRELLEWVGLKEEDLETGQEIMSVFKNPSEKDIEESYPVTLEEYLKKYDASQELQDYVNVLSVLAFVVPARYGSAGEFMYSIKNSLENPPSICYPKGSIGGIGEIFFESFKRTGGEFLEKKVEKINIEDDSVSGVKTSDGDTYRGNVVISNCGIQPTVFRLVGKKHFSKDYINWVESLYPSLGAIRIHYYLDEKITSKGAMLWIPSESFEEQTEKMKEGKLPEPGAFVTIPSNFDPDLSPSGKQAIVAASAAPPYPSFNVDAAKDWFEVLDSTVKKMLPSLEKHVEDIDYAASDTIASISGRGGVLDQVGGECIGLSQTPSQVGGNKPDPDSPIDGLFYVGTDAGGAGVGVIQAIDSGEAVSEIVQNYFS